MMGNIYYWQKNLFRIAKLGAQIDGNRETDEQRGSGSGTDQSFRNDYYFPKYRKKKWLSWY